MQTRIKSFCYASALSFFILHAPTLFAHGGAHDHDPKVKALPAETKNEGLKADTLHTMHDEYVQVIEPIFRKKCYDCHSDRTEYPWYYKIPGLKQWIDSDIKEAREHLDMSGGFPFTSKHSIDHDLEEIGEELEEGGMPPKVYVFVHAEAKLSESDKKVVLDWVERSRKTVKDAAAAPNH